MSAEKGIWVDHHFLTYSEIRTRNDFSEFNPYYSQSLELCHQWLNGQSNFQLKTSGSTGKPQSIRIVKDQIIASIIATQQALGLTHEDHALVCINTQYIGGMMMMFRSMEIQMNMTLINPGSNPLEDTDHNFDFYAFVPLQLEVLINNGYTSRLSKSKAIIIGGAPITGHLEYKLQQISAPCFHTFGMTETASHFALRRLNGRSKHSYYQCLPDVQIKSSDEGLLQVIGKITRNRWLTTNDRIEIVSPNQFIWKGRKDEVINSGGIKLYIPELETEIYKTLGVNHPLFFLSAVKDSQLGEKLIIIVEGKPVPGLLKNLKSKLREYHSPKEVYYLDHIPRTETGKIIKSEALKLLSIL